MTSHYCYFMFSGAQQTVAGGKWQRENRKDEKVEIHFHFALDPRFSCFSLLAIRDEMEVSRFLFSIVYLRYENNLCRGTFSP